MKKYFCGLLILVIILLCSCQSSQKSDRVFDNVEELKKWMRDIKEGRIKKDSQEVDSMADFLDEFPLYLLQPPDNLEQTVTPLIKELDDNLVRDKALKQLKRIFNKDFGYDTELWNTWLQENKNYLYFSKKENYFLIDEEAKSASLPTEEYRKTHPWPTESDKPKDIDKSNESPNK